MTVTPMSGGSGLFAVPGAGQFQQARSKVASAVADKLHLTVDQLTSQLSTSKSLADVAKANGLSEQDLKATVTSALQQANLPAGTDVNATADRMINHTGGHHHHHAETAQAGAAATPATPSPTTAPSYSNYLHGVSTDQTL